MKWKVVEKVVQKAGIHLPLKRQPKREENDKMKKIV